MRRSQAPTAGTCPRVWRLADLREVREQVLLGVEEHIQHPRCLAGAVAQERSVQLGIDVAKECPDLFDQRLGYCALVAFQHAFYRVEPGIQEPDVRAPGQQALLARSEEHTSALQSPLNI